MSAILLQSSATTPTLRRLNSREMLRSLPRSAEAQAAADKAQKNTRLLSAHEEEAEEASAKWLAPPLAPRVMAPHRLSKATDLSRRLQQIEYIEVGDVVKHRDDSKNYYTIHVYRKREESRIPTNQLHHTKVLHDHHSHHRRGRGHGAHRQDFGRAPDCTVERRYSEFEKLRKDLWETVQHPHRHYCTFCDTFMFMLLFSSAQPGMLSKALFRSTDLRAKLLDKFLHKIVGEFQTNRPRCRFACYSLEHLPVILHDFLFGEDETEDREAEEEGEEDPAASPTSMFAL